MKYLIAVFAWLISQGALAEAATSDPFADGQITCEEMHAFAQKIFTDDIDLGSGHGSPVAVDYYCKDGINTLPGLEDLLSLAESIRQQEPSLCNGSIVYAQHRYYSFRLLMAGIAPRQFMSRRSQADRVSALEAYFEGWALKSPSNYRRYQTFLDARKDAHSLLTTHYQKRLDFSPAQAEAIAHELIVLITARAAGSFPGSSSPATLATSPLSTAITAGSPDIGAIKQVLASKPSQLEIDQALRVALVRQLPLEIIAELTSQLDTLDSGDESALFFSLKYPQALELLLSRGAAVDYANSFGKTALFYGIEQNDKATVATLLEHGANPNHAYKSGAELESLRCVTHNIEHSARTALMHAAQHSNPEMLTLLLDRGARANDLDGVGWNALDYALDAKQQANLDFLRARGMAPAQSKVN